MKFLSTNKAPSAIGPYSQAIIVDNILYSSGQIAMNSDGGIVNDKVLEQTHQVMKNISYILESADITFNEIIKTTIFLYDMNDFEIVNKVYSEYFKEHKPVRSTIAVKTLPKNALIEIDFIAKIN